MCNIVKKSAEWNFFNLEISMFFNLSKNYSAEFFLIFSVFSSNLKKKKPEIRCHAFTFSNISA